MKGLNSRTAVGLTLGAVLLLAGVAPGATPAPAPISGPAPSGGTFSLTWRVTTGGVCERLRVRLKRDGAESRNCQARRGSGAHGLWQAVCSSGDLAIYGTAYSRRASVAFRTRSRRVVRGQRRGLGDRVLFVVVVGRRDLPGRLRIRSRDGRTLKTLEFGTLAQLCRGSGKGSPLEATYSF